MFGRSWRSTRVLIVCGDSPDPCLDNAFLRQPGIRLLTCRPDRGGLELARRKRPRLIIEDRAPGHGSPAFRRELRADPETRTIPLILLAGPHERPEGDGADVVLDRPVEPHRLFEAVRRFLPLPDRRHRRCRINLRFTYRGEGLSGQAFSRDVSCSGAFLKTDRTLAAGTPVEVGFRLPGAWEEIRCAALVVRNRAGHDPRLGGFAVEFQDLAEADAARLEAFIAEQHSSRSFLH